VGRLFRWVDPIGKSISGDINQRSRIVASSRDPQLDGS
jgi:hypothetical protein